MPDLTSAAMEDVITSIGSSISLRPTKMIVSNHGRAVAKMLIRAADERWNWRRLKRELRRAETSTYRRPTHA